MSATQIPSLYPLPSVGLSDEALAVSSSAVSLAASGWTAANTRYVQWQVKTDDVSVTFDGSTPTASNGFLLEQNKSGIWDLRTAKLAKFIRVTTDAVVHAQPLTI